jgi:phosphate-selective porin
LSYFSTAARSGIFLITVAVSALSWVSAQAQGPAATEPDRPAGEEPPPPPAPPTVLVQPVAPPASAAPAAEPPAPPAEPNARLDYNDGSFYLRSHHDNLVLTFGGRAHIDTYVFAGPGVGGYHRGNGTGLKPNLFFRRFIFEFGGMIRKNWFFWLGGNFVPQNLDANQVPISSANVYDGFVGYMPIPTLKIYLGQFNEPFTMENVTSSRWLDMMERALSVRTLATPYNKAEGLMAWGETHEKHFEYQVGVFGGDGHNRPNIDQYFDGTLRLLVRPLASRSDALKRGHIGVGGRIGRRNPDFVRYDAPSLTTPGNYAFWSATYGSGATQTVVIPSQRQAAASGELYVPFERWDFKGEVVYINEERREALAADRAKSLRGGLFWGWGAYGQFSYWPWGSPRINGNPAGYYGMTKLPDGTTGSEFPFALQLLARAEIIRMNYDPNSRSGDAGGLGNATHNIDVNAYQFCINYWMTKHVRLTAEYSFYQFPGTPIGNPSGTPDNQAVAPGAHSGGSAPDATSLSEISFRAGLAL